MHVTLVVILRIIPGTARTVMYDKIDLGGQMEPVEGLPECDVNWTLAEVSGELRVVRHHLYVLPERRR